MRKTLSSFEENEKKAYLLLLLNLAFQNGSVSSPELEKVYQIAEAAQIPKNWIEQTIAKAGTCSEKQLVEALAILASSDLKFPFIRDLYLVANADQSIEESEFKEINFFEEHLGLTSEQKEAIERFSIDLVTAQKLGQTPEEIQKIIDNYEQEFKEHGIPHSMTAQNYIENTLWNFETSVAQLDETTGMLALLVSPIIFTYEGLRLLLNKIWIGTPPPSDQEE
jgi:DnaJ-domain-containing protein 1